MFFLFLGIILKTSAESVEYLPFGIQLSYDLSENSVNFTLQVPIEYKSVFDWIGIGFKNSFDPVSFDEYDYLLILNDGSIYDSFKPLESDPVKDTEIGCTSDINPSFTETSYYSLYSWTRDLKTADDECDIQFVVGRPYALIYEFGETDKENGIKVFDEYSGFEYFILKDLYFDINDDERGRYGPWGYNS